MENKIQSIIEKYFSWNGFKEIDNSSLEYRQAKKFINPYLEHFENLDNEEVIQIFATLITAIRGNKRMIDSISEEAFKTRGKNWTTYHKMIGKFESLLGCFQYGLDMGSPKANMDHFKKQGWFKVKKITFEDDLGHKIVLQGMILNIIETMFNAFEEVYSKEDEEKLKNYSTELYDAYRRYIGELQWKQAEETTIAKKIIKNREVKDKHAAFNQFKYQTAYHLHCFLKAYTIQKSKAIYPANDMKIIGKFFSLVGIEKEPYTGYLDNKKISNYIQRGSPIKSSRTKDIKK